MARRKFFIHRTTGHGLARRSVPTGLVVTAGSYEAHTVKAGEFEGPLGRGVRSHMNAETAWEKVDRDVLPEETQAETPAPFRPIFQDWVMRLGLRLQGVLVSAIRGCDTAHRHDDSKIRARVYRSEVLRSHAGDPAKSKSFILAADVPTTVDYMGKFLNDCDHHPGHYVWHFLHAAEILGYYHPDPERRDIWNSFYLVGCRKYHVKPESSEELIARLEEKEEDVFHKNQDTTVTARVWEANRAMAKAESDRKAEEERKKREKDRALEASRYGVYGGT
jgi:hypothetical protein